MDIMERKFEEAKKGGEVVQRMWESYITYLGNDPLDGWYLLTFNYARGNKRVSSVEFIDEDTARFSLGLAI